MFARSKSSAGTASADNLARGRPNPTSPSSPPTGSASSLSPPTSPQQSGLGARSKSTAAMARSKSRDPAAVSSASSVMSRSKSRDARLATPKSSSAASLGSPSSRAKSAAAPNSAPGTASPSLAQLQRSKSPNTSSPSLPSSRAKSTASSPSLASQGRSGSRGVGRSNIPLPTPPPQPQTQQQWVNPYVGGDIMKEIVVVTSRGTFIVKCPSEATVAWTLQAASDLMTGSIAKSGSKNPLVAARTADGTVARDEERIFN
ncbi:hypothetical protein HDU67_001475, partial [Dinochytrium kinnereticum]